MIASTWEEAGAATGAWVIPCSVATCVSSAGLVEAVDDEGEYGDPDDGEEGAGQVRG